MKLISNEIYASLQAGNANWGALMSSIREADPTIPENASHEEIIAALTGGNNPDEALQQQLEAANSRITSIEAELASRNAEIAQLRNVPASPAATINPGASEPASEDKDPVAKINNEYADNTPGMMRAIQENGLI